MIEWSEPPANKNAAPVLEGQIVAGKYRIGRLLGAGSMGVVMAARHVELGHLVAIKFLSERVRSLAWGEERFRREARALARIESDHVAGISDIGVLPDGIPFFVMDYLEGENLLQLIERRGRLPVTEAVELVAQAVCGLVRAHAAGVIHRDIKPSNLFLARLAGGGCRVKILDFGIAGHVDQESENSDEAPLTERHAILGSPAYMAPEQLEGGCTIDAQADIWGCGVTLYELLTGHLPFSGTTPAQVAVQIHAKALSYSCQHSLIPPVVFKVVERCLSLKRGDRYPNAEALYAALTNVTVSTMAETLEFVPEHQHQNAEGRVRSAADSLYGARRKVVGRTELLWSFLGALVVSALVSWGIWGWDTDHQQGSKRATSPKSPMAKGSEKAPFHKNTPATRHKPSAPNSTLKRALLPANVEQLRPVNPQPPRDLSPSTKGLAIGSPAVAEATKRPPVAKRTQVETPAVRPVRKLKKNAPMSLEIEEFGDRK